MAVISKLELPSLDGVIDPISGLLRAIREHLRMDVAFISQVSEGHLAFRYVDAAGASPFQVGYAGPLEDTYCEAVIAGRLPGVIPDTAQNPIAAALPPTEKFNIGAYLAIPIRLGSGEIFGTYCCLHHRAKPELDERDLQMLKVFADVTARHIERLHEADQDRRRRLVHVRAHLALEPSWVVFQPIFDLRDNRMVSLEALARFPGPPAQPPDRWFADAQDVGLGPEFELAAIRRAMDAFATLPPGLCLHVNVSPAAIMGGGLAELLAGQPLRRLVIELTEHQPIADYQEFSRHIAPLRARGLRLAVDDAGAGYASFRHILQLRPDIIKLDTSLTERIHLETERRALATALIRFSIDTNMQIVAEGVETEAELACVRAIGAHRAQGYLLGAPMKLESLRRLA